MEPVENQLEFEQLSKKKKFEVVKEKLKTLILENEDFTTEILAIEPKNYQYGVKKILSVIRNRAYFKPYESEFINSRADNPHIIKPFFKETFSAKDETFNHLKKFPINHFFLIKNIEYHYKSLERRFSIFFS